MIQLSITKTVGEDAEKFVFLTDVFESDCRKAKEFAIKNNVLFELELSEETDSGGLRARYISLNALLNLLQPENESTQTIRNYCGISEQDDLQIAITYLSITCRGRVVISISTPVMNTNLKLASDVTSLQLGLELTFQSGIQFSKQEIKCKSKNTN